MQLYGQSYDKSLENFDYLYGHKHKKIIDAVHEQTNIRIQKWADAAAFRKMLNEKYDTNYGEIGGIIQDIGAGAEIVGYFTVMIPGGQVIGGALIATGRGLSFVGTIIEAGDDYSKGRNIEGTAKLVIELGVGGMTSDIIGKGMMQPKNQISIRLCVLLWNQ